MSEKTISKEEFLRLHNDSNVARKATTGSKADWEAIYAALKEVQEPLDISTIYKYYVKGVVTRYRTNNVLQRWAAQGKCMQIFEYGRYWFLFQVPEEAEQETE